MNFLVQPMPPSTDYMLHFPGFNEIWCDLISYEVPNVKISELCCSCQKERHGFSSGPSSILLSINFSIFSSYFWGNLVTDWNRQLFFLLPNADISTIHRGVGKLRNSCISLTRYENDMYLVLRALCWWLRGLRDSFSLLSSIDGNAKDPSKGKSHRTRILFTFLLVFDSLMYFIFRLPGQLQNEKFWNQFSCWLGGHLNFLEISSGSNKLGNPLCKVFVFVIPSVALA